MVTVIDSRVEIMSTPGGQRLKALREAAERTQLDVELDADLGSGYLQRVESGKVRHPERTTLERILAALGARYTQRRDILELFGYIVAAPLPTEGEIRWAIELCRAELDSAVFPAYLLDCAHRLLVWNAMYPRLYGVAATKRHQRLSMLKILFDPQYGVTPLISNPDIFFPATIRALRSETQLFSGEAWSDGLIDDVRLHVPLFEEYWTQSQPSYYVAARPLTPLEITLPDSTVLQFRLLAEPFIQDRRFRLIYYLPADAVTMQVCANWTLVT